MTADPLERIVQSLKASLDSDERSDAELLKQVRTNRDPAAIEAIVRRHGPKVIAACRKVLGDSTEVDDAFQATFCALLHSPTAIRKKASLGSWLFGVAHRIALQARKRHFRKTIPVPDVMIGETDFTWREACVILHEELDHLPDTLRLPLVSCYLEGLSRDEAARELGRSIHSIKKSLEKGRAILRMRLSKRGVTLSAGLIAAVAEPVTAELSGNLIWQTVNECLQPSKPISHLSHTVPSNWNSGRLIGSSLAISVLVLVASFGMFETPEHPPPTKEPQAKKNASKSKPGELRDKIAFSGRVVDPEGKPVKGAKIHFAGRALARYFDNPGPELRAISDGNGRFHIELDVSDPKISIGLVGLGIVLCAHSEKFGVALQSVGNEGDADLLLRLVKNVPLRGRLVDTLGKPVGNASVRVVVLRAPENDNPIPGIERLGRFGWSPGFTGELWGFLREMRAEQFPLPGLPESVRTDAQGWFEIRGMGVDRLLTLRFEGSNFATTEAHVLVQAGKPFIVPHSPWNSSPSLGATIYRSGFQYVVEPTQVIEGTIKDKATGKPIAGMIVGSDHLTNRSRSNNWWNCRVRSITDKEGRYRLLGLSKGIHSVVVYPPTDLPYFRYSSLGGRENSLQTARLDFDLPAGVWVEGRVTDIRTTEPVSNARIHLHQHEDNARTGEFIGQEKTDLTYKYSKDDGTFRILAIPGRNWLSIEHGHRFVSASLREIQGDFKSDRKSGFSSGNAWVGVEVDLKNPKKYAVTLDSGRRVAVYFFDPAGKELAGVAHIEPTSRSWRWSLPSASSKSQVPVINPNDPPSIFFYQADRKLGVVYSPTKGKAPLPRIVGPRGEPLAKEQAELEFAPWKVALQPTATVSGRLVGPDGMPLGHHMLKLRYRRFPSVPLPDARGDFKTDAKGRFQFKGLIGQLQYELHYTAGAPLVYETVQFELKPGEAKDLGELRPKVPAK